MTENNSLYLTKLSMQPFIKTVVGGRLDYKSDTELAWNFWESNTISLWNGAEWTMVSPIAPPTLLSTTSGINGVALTYDVVYDIFAEYSTPTTFNLVASKWMTSGAGTSDRKATWVTGSGYLVGDRVVNSVNYYTSLTTHTGGTFAVDLAAGRWADNGTDPGTDFRGLYLHDGIWVEGNSETGKKRRWLGVVMLYNNSGTKWINNQYYRYVSNFYNTKLVDCLALNTTANSWTYNSSTFRETNGGTGAVRARFICATNKLIMLMYQARIAGGSAYWAYFSYGKNSTTTAGGSWLSLYDPTAGSSTNLGSLFSHQSFAVGFNYITMVESTNNGTVTIHGWDNCQVAFSLMS
jgi:hypothetical protein